MRAFSSLERMNWRPKTRTPDPERLVLEEVRREIGRFDELAEDVAQMLRSLSPDDPIRERIIAILREGKKLTGELEAGS